MAALSNNRLTRQNGDTPVGSLINFPIKDNVHIYIGALCVLDLSAGTAGRAAPATAAGSLVAAGVALAEYDNTVVGHVAEAFNVKMLQGEFWFANKVGDEVVAADVGSDCYIENDQTVRHTAAATSRAGKVLKIDATYGVLVRVGVGL